MAVELSWALGPNLRRVERDRMQMRQRRQQMRSGRSGSGISGMSGTHTRTGTWRLAEGGLLRHGEKRLRSPAAEEFGLHPQPGRAA